MKSVTFFFVLILVLAFITESQSRLFDKPHLQGSEMRGKGITDDELSFIKSKAIEVAKMSRPLAESNAQRLEIILNAGLKGVWGVFIIPNPKDPNLNIGIFVGQPLDDKWWQADQFGPYSWTYAIWKQRN